MNEMNKDQRKTKDSIPSSPLMSADTKEEDDSDAERIIDMLQSISPKSPLPSNLQTASSINVSEGGIAQQNIWQLIYQAKQYSDADLAALLEKWTNTLKTYAETERTNDTDIAKGIHLYVDLKGGKFPGATTGTLVENEIINDFLKDNKAKIFLLLGDPGAGKSLFGRRLEETLWNKYKQGSYIPIFIFLPFLQASYPNAANGKLVPKTLASKGMPLFLINYIREKKIPLFLILDGYDEAGLKSNLYNENRLDEWNIKILITCRSQYLSGHHAGQFQQKTAGHQLIPDSLIERYLVPFEEKEIEKYIENFANSQNNPQKEWEKEQCFNALQVIQNWQTLAQEPFVLNTILTILPTLSLAFTKKGHVLTRFTIYEEFLRHLLEKGYERIVGQGSNFKEYFEVKFKDKNDYYRKKYVISLLQAYSSKLAFALFEKGQILMAEPTVNLLVKDETLEDMLVVEGEWKDFFYNPDPDMQKKLDIALSGSPLKKVRTNPLNDDAEAQMSYLFFHKSMQDYLAAKTIFQALRGIDWQKADEKHIETLLETSSHFNRFILHKKDPAIPYFLGELANYHLKEFSIAQALFKIIQFSRGRPQYGRAAANAMTILNYGSVSLSGQDFNSTYLDEVDLSGAFLDHTNFNNASMNEATLSQSWLRGTTFDGAKMENVHFDAYPFLGTGAFVTSMAITPDNKHLVIGNRKHSLQIWERSTSKLLFRCDATTNNTLQRVISQPNFLAENDPTSTPWEETVVVDQSSPSRIIELKKANTWMNAVAVSSDAVSLKIAAAGKWPTNTLRVWELSTLKEISCPSIGNILYDIRFSKNNDRIHAITDDSFLSIDLIAKQFTTYKLCQKDVFRCLAFSPKEEYLAIGCEDGTIIVYPFQNEIPQQDQEVILHEHAEAVQALIFSHDGSFLISGSNDTTIKTWTLSTLAESQKSSWTGNSHASFIWSLCLTPDDQNLLSSSGDQTIIVWDMTQKTVIDTIGGHQSWISRVLVVNDHIISAGEVIRTWDRHTVKHSAPRKFVPTHSLRGVCFNSDEKYIIAGGGSQIAVWETSTGLNVKAFDTNLKEEITWLVPHPTSPHRVIVCYHNTMFQVWDFETGLALDTKFSGHTGPLQQLAASSNGDWVASASFDHSVRLWKIETGECMKVFIGHKDKVYAVAMKGEYVVSGGWDTQVIVWHIDSPSPHKVYSGHKRAVTQAEFTADDRYIISAGGEGEVRIWDRKSGACLREFREHKKTIYGLAVHPIHNIIAMGGAGGIITLWELKENMDMVLLHSLPGSNRWIDPVRFSANGEKIVSAGGDCAVKLWQFYETFENIRLIWSHPLQGLIIDGVIFKGATLSPRNKQLLAFANQEAQLKGSLLRGTLLSSEERNTISSSIPGAKPTEVTALKERPIFR